MTTRRTVVTLEDESELVYFVKGHGQWNPESPSEILISIVSDMLVADGIKPRDAERVAPAVLRRLASFRPAK